jgi:hypothetical protein
MDERLPKLVENGLNEEIRRMRVT